VRDSFQPQIGADERWWTPRQLNEDWHEFRELTRISNPNHAKHANAISSTLKIPKGLNHSAQRWRAAATLGKRPTK
jgi:hypothetical protein